MYNFIPQHRTELQVTQSQPGGRSASIDYSITDSGSNSANTATERLFPESENEIGGMPPVVSETGDTVSTRPVAIQEAGENIDAAEITAILSVIWLTGALVLAVYI